MQKQILVIYELLEDEGVWVYLFFDNNFLKKHEIFAKNLAFRPQNALLILGLQLLSSLKFSFYI